MMLKRLKKIFYFLTIFLCSSFYGQDKNIDSLINALPTTHDSLKAFRLFTIAQSLTYDSPEESQQYAEDGIKLLRSQKDTMITLYARYNTQLGVLQKNLGNFNQAAIYQHNALDIHEVLGEENDSYKASVYNDLGIIYKTMENWEAALEYYRKSNEICKKLELSQGVLMTYNNIGTVLIRLDYLDSAEHYYIKAYDLSVQNEDLYGQALTLNNLGELYAEQGDLEKALEKFLATLEIDRKTGDRFGIVYTLMNIGGAYHELGEDIEAERYLVEGVDIAREQNANYLLAKILSTLSLVMETQNKYMPAYKSLKESRSLNDSIFNEEKNQQLSELEAKYQNEKKQQEIELQQSKLNAKDAELEVKQAEKQFFMYGIVFAVLVVLILIYSWNSKRKDNGALKQKNVEIETQKLSLEEQHKEITDSIQYAKRIQSAILPPKKIVKEYLENSFILYKPKDIVAGDFYWLEHKEGKVLFAAADCTGHGVPGAMVSVVCNNGLNRSVREHGLTDPGSILDKTRKIVIQEFEKSEEEVKDGMDIALCSLDGLKLEYAGAHNPLWIIRNGPNGYREIIETKANKQPIGKFDNQQPYTTHTFDLQKDDTIYIFSDGYVDQFGGERGKKFKAKAFRKLLLSIQDKSMEEQRILIDDAFENWRGDLEQIDDVCVIGVRV